MRILPVGRDAVLVEVASPQDAVALAAWARARSLAGEVVPGAETVLFDGMVDADALSAALDIWTPGEAPLGRLVEIPVAYDGVPPRENGR